jgi:hypothetical protein
MTAQPTNFKRMVLRLPQNREDYAAVGMTARLAELLGLELVATFVEDTSLVEVAALSCVREFRPFAGGWQPIEVTRLAQEIERTSATARRLFKEAMRAVQTEASFNLARGSAADAIVSLATAEDIIVIIEPKNPAERVTQQFVRLVDAAFKAASAVLMMPHRLLRTVGPIVAFATTADDTSIHTAIGIAAAAQESVIVLGDLDSRARVQISELAQSSGVRLTIAPALQQPMNMATLIAGLVPLNERLVVISRSVLEDMTMAKVASVRGIPVLIVEADRNVAIRPPTRQRHAFAV